MVEAGGSLPQGGTELDESTPRAPLGHLSRLGFALRSAPDVDEIARAVLVDLISLPGVSRVAVALSEGGGRRLRFVASESLGDAGDEGVELEWCHIDAYDDVPLTTVVRTGEPVLGRLDDLAGRFPAFLDHQREQGTAAIAAWPLPGVGSPIGGLMVFFDTPTSFPRPLRGLLEATSRRVADAVQRVRITSGRGPGDAAPDDPALIGEGERVSLLLESDPRAPGASRAFLRDQLASWGVGTDDVETAQLCLSELVTNVVMHAGTTSELTLHLEDSVLTVVVRDLGGSSRHGGRTPKVRVTEDDDPMRVFGRGLILVDALASRWGSEVDASGTTAWFALELDTHSAQTG